MNCDWQQLHEVVKTDFMFRGGSIPRWLDKESRGPSISFSFCNQFPPNVLCFVIVPVLDDFTSNLVTPVVLINGKVQEYHSKSMEREVRMLELDHTHLFDLLVLPSRKGLIGMYLENEWKHVEITYEGLFDTSLIKSTGIHIVKSKRRGMKDIRYYDPYTTTKMWPCVMAQEIAREDYDTAATQVNSPITRRKPTKPKHLNDYDCRGLLPTPPIISPVPPKLNIFPCSPTVKIKNY